MELELSAFLREDFFDLAEAAAAISSRTVKPIRIVDKVFPILIWQLTN